MLEFSDLGPTLSLSDIEGQEGRFGEAFPAAYREFLLTCNGGIPSLDGVEIDGLVESPTDVQVFHGINRDEETETLDWNLDVVRESCKGAQVLPVACDSFGNLFCLRQIDGQWRVIYLDYSGGKGRVYDVAPDFGAFLGKLMD